jgi:L-2-hydroxyglutarate oxidase LhgO
MTKDEIIEMARQARLMSEYDEASPWVEDHEITQYVEAFAKLVAAKEREACALICDKEVEDWKYDADVVDVAIAIRARGQA